MAEVASAAEDFQDNAKLCFKQARKILRGVEKLTPLLEEVETKIKRWQADAAKSTKWKAELVANGMLSDESAESVLQLYETMLDENLIKRPEPPPVVNEKEEASKSFKKKYGKDIDCYRSPNGHEVIVGRSSRTNEYVSLKLAKKDMVWFHTDNRIPGSHVLIKALWDDVNEEDIEFAAKLAAYHSKAKDMCQAPVMYCRGQSVRKIKGSPTGMVSIAGDKFQITVTPELPAESS